MTTRSRIVLLVVLVVALIAPAVRANAAPAPSFTTLEPGKPATLTEEVPVQVVFVGYEQDQIDDALFREYLLGETRTVDRRRTYRAGGQPVHFGLDYTYDYDLVYADATYEDAFFAHLLASGVNERDLTGYDESLYQYLYNLQPARSLDITNNLVIEATAVERWLVEHPAPGIDSDRDTIVFVNWWGRPDFRFHEYTVTGEQQSEGGRDFGERWESRLIAWGGTAAHDEETGFGRKSRVWFHDLSAGPDWRTGNWVMPGNPLGFGPDLNVATVFPPAWEYLLGNATDRWSLTEALGVVFRFVGLNMLFTPSPLYGYDNDARMTSDIELDVTVQSQLHRPVVTPSHLQNEVGDLLGSVPRVDVEAVPLTGMVRKCLFDFASLQRCRPETDPAIYDVDFDLYLATQATRRQWQDGSAEYEAPGFVRAANVETKWLGVAYDAPSGERAAAETLPRDRTLDAGYGSTSTLIHEYGHHFGMSHSHDGWEGTWGEYGYSAASGGIFYFAWVGTEVSSVMSYLFVNDDFSQFDLDNYQRWQATRYLRAANMISADVLASRRAAAGHGSLREADTAFTRAQAALSAHDYPAAARLARDGYAAVRAAARATGTAIDVDTSRWELAQPGKWRGRGHADGIDPAADPIDQIDAHQAPADVVTRFEASAR